MGHKVSWKTGVLICHPVTSRPLIFPQKEAVLSPCNFVTTHLTVSSLNFHLPLTSRPMKWGPFRNTPIWRPLKASPPSQHKQFWGIHWQDIQHNTFLWDALTLVGGGSFEVWAGKFEKPHRNQRLLDPSPTPSQPRVQPLSNPFPAESFKTTVDKFQENELGSSIRTHSTLPSGELPLRDIAWDFHRPRIPM